MLLVDFDVTEERIEIEVDDITVCFIVTPLTVENANIISTYYTGMVLKKDIEPDRFLKILKKIIREQVKGIEGIEVRENGVVRDATPEDMTKHSGFYQLTMELLGRLNSVSSLSKEDEEGFQNPVVNGSLQEELKTLPE